MISQFIYYTKVTIYLKISPIKIFCFVWHLPNVIQNIRKIRIKHWLYIPSWIWGHYTQWSIINNVWWYSVRDLTLFNILGLILETSYLSMIHFNIIVFSSFICSWKSICIVVTCRHLKLNDIYSFNTFVDYYVYL